MDKLLMDKIKSSLPRYMVDNGIPINGFFRCLNPCHEDKHPSMRYNSKNNTVHCFSCGVTYDIFGLIGITYKNDNFIDQYKLACKLLGYEDDSQLEYVDGGSHEKEFKRLYNSKDALSDYLRNRGISQSNINKYNLFERYGRVYFPIFSDFKCTAWTSRAINDNYSIRYINSKGDMGIWNIDYIKQYSDHKKLFITEGIIDAISIEEHGGNAVALCGVGNCKKFIKLCEQFSSTSLSWKMVICSDPDKAGKTMTQTLSKEFSRLKIVFDVMELSVEDVDINYLHVNNPKKLDMYMIDSIKKLEVNHTEDFGKQDIYSLRESNIFSEISVGDSLDEFFDDCENRGSCVNISTGFEGIDSVLDGGLHTGVYVIGAGSSVGKTSLMLQIADNISQNGIDVVYISLEQSKSELISKSLSRLTTLLDVGLEKNNSFTSREILTYTGETLSNRRKLLSSAKDEYRKNASNLFIKDGICGFTTEQIREYVNKLISYRQNKIVLMIDYLQIIAPSKRNYTDKQNIDQNIIDIKRISQEFDIPVLVTSSFNRESYKLSVSMESFKESGAVEYSADVLIGLQYKGIGTKGFNINTARLKNPRDLELIVLKNRNGIPYAKIDFKYDCKHNLFWENKKKQQTYMEKNKVFAMDIAML